MADAQESQRESSPETSADVERKPYAPPQLTAYGSLAKLTQNAGFIDLDPGFYGTEVSGFRGPGRRQ